MNKIKQFYSPLQDKSGDYRSLQIIASVLFVLPTFTVGYFVKNEKMVILIVLVFFYYAAIITWYAYMKGRRMKDRESK